MRKILPVLIALGGLAAGTGAGLYLRPPEPAAGTVVDSAAGTETAPGGEIAAASPETGTPATDTPSDYLKLNNQFIVPVLEGDRVASLVVLALGLEIAAGQSEVVFAREPKLQDAFLQVLFDHANAGGFRGSFTDAGNLVFLRKALLEKAQAVLGPVVTDVLITEIARQDS